MDLALEAEVSSRHISFLETGRARPSRDMILRLCEALRLPLVARNQLLTHAGFVAAYPSRHWEDADMAPIRAAVSHMLDNHTPFPALALDRLWTVVQMNAVAARLFGMLGLGAGDSLLDLMTSQILADMVENWPDVARHAALRLRTESAAQGGVPELDRTADMLGKAAVASSSEAKVSPVVPTVLNLGGQRLSLFATIAQFGTPEDLALDDLKIEFYFPADAQSRSVLNSLA